MKHFKVKWMLLAIVVAAMSGTASAAFLIALDWVSAVFNVNRWLIWLLPVTGFVVGWVYLKVGQDVEGGNNLLIDEIHDPKKVLPLRMAPLILVSTLLSHLVGASVGREGTAVQMGGALADQLTRLFKLKAEDRRIVLMSGISAGFASVFGTPLAGAVFGFEVLAIGRLRYDALLPCFVAAIVANQVTGLWGVHHLSHSAGVLPAITPWVLCAVAIAGVAFGLTALAFAQATHRLSAHMKRLVPYAPWRPALGGVVIALLVWGFGAWRYTGLSLPALADAFAHPVVMWDSAAKWAFTVAAIGTGFKGGEVTPLFVIGATLGNALAPLLHLPFGMLAALGFAAVFAGAANTPLACTFMAMELFGADIGVFAALACVASYLASGHVGIYKAQRRQSDAPFS